MVGLVQIILEQSEVKFRVRNGKNPNSQIVKRGVAQGSILGPLFLVIN